MSGLYSVTNSLTETVSSILSSGLKTARNFGGYVVTQMEANQGVAAGVFIGANLVIAKLAFIGANFFENKIKNRNDDLNQRQENVKKFLANVVTVGAIAYGSNVLVQRLTQYSLGNLATTAIVATHVALRLIFVYTAKGAENNVPLANPANPPQTNLEGALQQSEEAAKKKAAEEKKAEEDKRHKDSEVLEKQGLDLKTSKEVEAFLEKNKATLTTGAKHRLTFQQNSLKTAEEKTAAADKKTADDLKKQAADKKKAEEDAKTAAEEAKKKAEELAKKAAEEKKAKDAAELAKKNKEAETAAETARKAEELARKAKAKAEEAKDKAALADRLALGGGSAENTEAAAKAKLAEEEASRQALEAEAEAVKAIDAERAAIKAREDEKVRQDQEAARIAAEEAEVIRRAQEAEETFRKALEAEEAAKKVLEAEEAAKKALEAEEAAKKALEAEEAAKKALEAEEAAKKALEAEEAAKKALEAEEAAKKALEAEEAAKKALEAEEAAKKALEAEEAAKQAPSLALIDNGKKTISIDILSGSPNRNKTEGAKAKLSSAIDALVKNPSNQDLQEAVKKSQASFEKALRAWLPGAKQELKRLKEMQKRSTGNATYQRQYIPKYKTAIEQAEAILKK